MNLDVLREYMNGFLTSENLSIIDYVDSSCKRVYIKSKYGIHNCPYSTLSEYRIPDINSAINKTEYVINKYIEVHGDLYNYSNVEYTGSNCIISIICQTHGEFKQTHAGHLNGNGCAECGRERQMIDEETFLNRSINKHGNKYDYSNIEYINYSTPVLIGCEKHGQFLQMPIQHALGHGCSKCAKENNLFKKSEWIKAGESSIKFDSFKLYLIECYNDSERFLKIGRTFNSVGIRFSGGMSKMMPYHYKVLNIIEGDGAYIYDLETELHKQFKHYKFKPRIPFGGETECYNIDVKNIINSNIRSERL